MLQDLAVPECVTGHFAIQPLKNKVVTSVCTVEMQEDWGSWGIDYSMPAARLSLNFQLNEIMNFFIVHSGLSWVSVICSRKHAPDSHFVNRIYRFPSSVALHGLWNQGHTP